MRTQDWTISFRLASLVCSFPRTAVASSLSQQTQTQSFLVLVGIMSFSQGQGPGWRSTLSGAVISQALYSDNFPVLSGSSLQGVWCFVLKRYARPRCNLSAQVALSDVQDD